MKIKCLIVDDEPLAIKVIQNYLLKFENFEVVATCENSIDAFNIVEEKEVDLLFMDIEMPLVTGLDFIRSLENPPEIIITTAHRDYAVESFELDVLDYLVKPISFPRFMKAIRKATKIFKLKKGISSSQVSHDNVHVSTDIEDAFIFLKVDKKMVKVYLKDILYIESLKDYIRVKTQFEELIVHQTLTGITDSLPSENFVRIHRSFTISIAKVKAIEGNCVEIAGKKLPIGRNYLPEAKEKIYKSNLLTDK